MEFFLYLTDRLFFLFQFPLVVQYLLLLLKIAAFIKFPTCALTTGHSNVVFLNMNNIHDIEIRHKFEFNNNTFINLNSSFLWNTFEVQKKDNIIFN